MKVVPLNEARRHPPTPLTTIVVGTTLAAFAMTMEERWSAWLSTAEQIKASHPDVRFFAAIEVDGRGIRPFHPLLDRLRELGGEWWTFSLDDGRETVTTENRLRHITMGQNLVVDFCSMKGVSHLLFVAADTQPPPDVLPKLLEVDHGLVGAFISTYCLSGPTVPGYPFPVREHMASAALVLIRRDVFKRLRWRWDIEEGMSDDPAYHRDAIDLLGMPTYVRQDVEGRHFPEAIGPIETRYTPEAMKVVRVKETAS